MADEKRMPPADCQPNIVLLMTDQQKAGAMGAYGNPHPLSPFQDRMAREGIRFADAYANAPICTPSRASIMTGVHPLVHASTCHQNRVPYNLPQLAELLQQSGYYTAATGHYEPLRNLDRGWHEQSDQSEPGPLYKAWNNWLNHGRKDVGWSSGALDVDAEHGHSALLTNRAIRLLDNAADTGKPFFLHVAYNDPHPPYFVPPPYDTLFDAETVELYPQGSPDGRPPWQFRCMADNGTEKATDADLRKVKAVYYGMIAYANAQMERLYQAMAQRGMLSDTWFILASDHGDYTGEKGLFCKTESLYECLLHIPLIIRPPQGSSLPRGQTCQGFVDTTDIFSTILGLAGVPVPGYAQGYDLIEWVRSGAKEALRDRVYAQIGDYHGHLKTTLPGGITESGRHPGLLQGVRTQRYAYSHDPDYGDEAYDLEADPWELENLFNPGKPDVPQEIYALKESVEQWRDHCLDLKKRLGIVPGDRGFADGVLFEEKP